MVNVGADAPHAPQRAIESRLTGLASGRRPGRRRRERESCGGGHVPPNGSRFPLPPAPLRTTAAVLPRPKPAVLRRSLPCASHATDAGSLEPPHANEATCPMTSPQTPTDRLEHGRGAACLAPKSSRSWTAPASATTCATAAC